MAKRKIPCNYCKGEVLATQNGKTTSSGSLFPRLQNFLTSIGDLMSAVMGGPKSISRKEAIGGKCEACGGSGQIEDPTDTSDADKQAADFLKGKAEAIEAAEKRLGHSPGGSLLERVAGAKVTIVGRTLNNAKSVTVHEGKARYPTSQVVEKAGPTTTSSKDGTNVVTGNNVPANTGGGVYYIQCGNKFKLTVGAQGIEMGSYGPISIDGTQVRVTGAEVTIGGSRGPTVIEGDHLQLNGKSIALTPSGKSGEVVIQGAASVSGNFRAGGLYAENLYASSITCPTSQVSTKVAAGTTDYVGGPSKWGGLQTSFPKVAVQNMVKWAKDSTMDVNLAGSMSPINPRSIMKTNDNMMNMAYGIIPYELMPTGYILPGTTISLILTNITGLATAGQFAGTIPVTGPITITGGTALATVAAPITLNNFPHTHALPDSPHTHDVTVPAINHDGNSSAEAVREKFKSAGGNSSAPATDSGNQNILSSVVGAVKGVVDAGTALVQPYNTVA